MLLANILSAEGLVPLLISLLAAAALLLAAVPAVLFTFNLPLYRAPRCGTGRSAAGARPRVSLLIPARDESATISDCLDGALASENVELEVLVGDDHSTDATAAIVSSWAARDRRVRLVRIGPLPAGWCGKQHACWQLAQAASSPWLVFIDADVRLHPAALSDLVTHAAEHRIDLLSGFPRQITGTWLERLVIPLMHFVLLGFLPLARMRHTNDAACSAGCGQLFVAQRAAYFVADGHRAVRGTLHDGLMLPRAFRRAGRHTDLVDVTALAACRMYRTTAEVCSGLAKNALEGLAAPAVIVPATFMLIGGQVVPFAGLITAGIAAVCGAALPGAVVPLLAAASVLAWYPRWVAVWRFRQSPLGAAAHPLGVLLLVAIQWYALARWMLGRPATWKERSYGAGGGLLPEAATADGTSAATSLRPGTGPAVASPRAPTPSAAPDALRCAAP
jgi:hypothetical protein